MLDAMFGKRRNSQQKDKAGDFHHNSSVVEQHLKLAIQSESENGTRIRAELEELRRMQQAQSAETERKMRELARIKKDVEVLRLLVKGGSGGHRQVMAENDSLSAEISSMSAERAAQRDELAALQRALAAEQAAAEEQRRVHERRLKQLVDEKSKVETLIASAQVAQLDQNFSAKTSQMIEAEARAIFSRSFALLPLHKDLPRLVKSTNVTDMDSNLIFTPDPKDGVELSVRAFLVALGGRLDGPELVKRIHDNFATYLDEKGGRDAIKGTMGLLKNVVGENSKTVFVLRASANQSIIAPVVGYLSDSLSKTLPFRQVKGEWKITVTLGERVLHVTHRKKEESTPEAEDMYCHFVFSWQVDFTLDPLSLEMRSMEVRMTDVKVADPKHEHTVTDLLQKSFSRFQPKQGSIIRIPVAVSSTSLKP